MRTNPAHTIPSLSGTFGIPARLALNPKMPKEPSSPSRSNVMIERRNNMIINALKNKGQLVTRYIKHLAESAKFKGGTFNKLCNGLIGNRFEMPNVSYTNPLCTMPPATVPTSTNRQKPTTKNLTQE
ncbi:hypothetical protein [Proteiniphilum sp.]|uniref:hypothetical protein n=1 Tax=Proteiniphilum sp. TaxID=1926877 RepID=UPI003333317E